MIHMTEEIIKRKYRKTKDNGGSFTAFWKPLPWYDSHVPQCQGNELHYKN